MRKCNNKCNNNDNNNNINNVVVKSTAAYVLLTLLAHYAEQGLSNGRESVRPSVRLPVCLFHHSAAARRCSGFAAQQHGAAVRRSAANASSVTFTAAVWSWMQTCSEGRWRQTFGISKRRRPSVRSVRDIEILFGSTMCVSSSSSIAPLSDEL